MDYNPKLETIGAERPVSFVTPAELNGHVKFARLLRSDATAATLAGALRALARAARAMVAGAARWWERRATQAALTRCNDRVLADIGIEREDIPLIAHGLDPMRAPAPESGVQRSWPALLAHVEVLAMIWRGASHGWLGRHPQTVADRA
jgi:uncharacterized protein YjiS (DUF1127 family)